VADLALAVTAAFLGPLIAASAALDLNSHGWYWRYTVNLLFGQGVVRKEWVDFWRVDLGMVLWPTLAALAAAVIARRAVKAPWWIAAAGMAGASWVSRLHSGGYSNVLMPAFAAAALLLGLAIGALLDDASPAVWVATTLAVLQIAVLSYNPSRFTPTFGYNQAGARLVAAIRAVHGPVLIESHSWYAELAGKPGFVHAAIVQDIERSHSDVGRLGLEASLADGVHRRLFGAILLDGGSQTGLPADLSRYYSSVQPPAVGPLPLSDALTRVTQWWVPRAITAPNS
jgi:hypothetical protein